MRISDQYSCIPSKTKRYKLRAYDEKRCCRCGQPNERHPKTHCTICAEKVALLCKNYEKKTRTPLRAQVAKLKQFIIELRRQNNELREELKRYSGLLLRKKTYDKTIN